jgi:hypothetical protein
MEIRSALAPPHHQSNWYFGNIRYHFKKSREKMKKIFNIEGWMHEGPEG